MNKYKFITLTLFLLLFLCGCSKASEIKHTSPPSSNELQNNQLNENSHSSVTTLTTDEEPFTYIAQLSTEKQASLRDFIESRNIQTLTHFTPEDIVLSYFHLITEGKIDLIYLITYNNNLLPDIDSFLNEYFNNTTNIDSEMVVHYRYYDSISILDMNEDKTSANVEISVGIGIIKHTALFGLYKEDEIWKIDIYHLIKNHT